MNEKEFQVITAITFQDLNGEEQTVIRTEEGKDFDGNDEIKFFLTDKDYIKLTVERTSVAKTEFDRRVHRYFHR